MMVCKLTWEQMRMRKEAWRFGQDSGAITGANAFKSNSNLSNVC